MASGQTLCVFVPLMNQPPSSNYALFAILNNMPVLNYGALPSNPPVGIFPGVMPQNYSGVVGVNVNLYFTGDAAPASHNIVWKVDWERDQIGASIASDNFDSADAQTFTVAAPTLGQVSTCTVSFTTAQAAGIVAGDAFRLRVMRNSASASDNFTGNAQLFRVELRDR